MAFERPTFHEAWYRVEPLHPRLRSTVQITKQFFRGQTWHVVQDHTNNAFFRLSEPGYFLVGLLDGKRTVGEAWKTSMEQMGDDAPTQGETIQLLGQLYTSNLLMAEVPADAEGLFSRYKKRKTREMQGYLQNIMFSRIPLIDPDAFLERWMPALGWIFSWAGLAVWSVLIGIAIYFLMNVSDPIGKLMVGGKNVLAPENLIMLYTGFACIKACHEFGHALSCKKFGMKQGVGGEVHAMGIMFLVFSPVPYVDASSSWALTSKWQRIVVSAAGMWVELAIASIFAIIWVQTGESTAIHQFAYNIMFVASFSTLVFNANPLLRYDGYYILSDLLEIPNLGQRSKDYIYYVVRRYALGVKRLQNPAFSWGEKTWMVVYCIASFAMRVFVSVRIMLYLAGVLQGVLIFLAVIMGLAGVITWVAMPIGKFLHYLLTSPELMRTRPRAIASVAAVVLLAGVCLGALNAPDRVRAEGIVDVDMGDSGAPAMVELNPEQSGFITEVLTSAPRDGKDKWGTGEPIAEKDQAIYVAKQRELEAELQVMRAQKAEFDRRYVMALAEEIAKNQGKAQSDSLLYQLQQLDDVIRDKERELGELTMRAPFRGLVVSDGLENSRGAFVHQGDKIGWMIDLDRKVVIAAVPNDMSGSIRNEATGRVEMRVLGRPDLFFTGTFTETDIASAGRDQLRSPALGSGAGGSLAVATDDRQGKKTTEHFFEVRIHVDPGANGVRLLPGQRVMARFDLKPKPLLMQGYTAVRQLVQQRFGL